MGVMVDIGVVGNEAATAGEPANLWQLVEGGNSVRIAPTSAKAVGL